MLNRCRFKKMFFFQDFLQNKAKCDYAAFFIFLYPKTYSKIFVESVIGIPEPLLVSLLVLNSCKNKSRTFKKKALG